MMLAVTQFLSSAGSRCRSPFVRLLPAWPASSSRAWNWRRAGAAAALAPLCLLLTSCPALDGRHLNNVIRPVSVTAQVLANLIVVDGRIAGEPVRLLVDTGSSISLISPELAQRHSASVAMMPVNLVSASGEDVELSAITLPHLAIGEAGFTSVRAAVYDMAGLSHHLGQRIDGVLGFSAVRELAFTVDYPARRIGFAPSAELSSTAADTIALDVRLGVPVIGLSFGDTRFAALIDSGSDTALTLAGPLASAIAPNSRPGQMRASLDGDRPTQVGRAAHDLALGRHRLEQPLVETVEGLPTLGGALLRHFVVTFDARRGTVAFERAEESAVPAEPHRSIGVSFYRGAENWRVASVVPETPAALTDIAIGEACVAINGEPTVAWPMSRYLELVRDARDITFTFASDTARRDVRLPVVELVP